MLDEAAPPANRDRPSLSRFFVAVRHCSSDERNPADVTGRRHLMAKKIDETLEFAFGSGGQSGMAGSATRMRRIRTRDVRKVRDEADFVRSDWVHRRAVRAARSRPATRWPR